VSLVGRARLDAAGRAECLKRAEELRALARRVQRSLDRLAEDRDALARWLETVERAGRARKR